VLLTLVQCQSLLKQVGALFVVHGCGVVNRNTNWPKDTIFSMHHSEIEIAGLEGDALSSPKDTRAQQGPIIYRLEIAPSDSSR
jgi:hypothetical protein